MKRPELQKRLEKVTTILSGSLVEIATTNNPGDALTLVGDIADVLIQLHANTVANLLVLMMKCAQHPDIDDEARDRLHTSIRLVIPKACEAFTDIVRSQTEQVCVMNQMKNVLDTSVNAATREEILKMMEGDHTEDGT